MEREFAYKKKQILFHFSAVNSMQANHGTIGPGGHGSCTATGKYLHLAPNWPMLIWLCWLYLHQSIHMTKNGFGGFFEVMFSHTLTSIKFSLEMCNPQNWSNSEAHTTHHIEKKVTIVACRTKIAILRCCCCCCRCLWTKTHNMITMTFCSHVGGVHQSRQLLSRTEWRWQSKSRQRTVQFRSSVGVQWNSSASSAAGHFGREKSHDSSIWLQKKFTVISMESHIIIASPWHWPWLFFTSIPDARTMKWSFILPTWYFLRAFWCSIFQPSEICSTWNCSLTQTQTHVSHVEVNNRMLNKGLNYR